jgi:hypothetical protein
MGEAREVMDRLTAALDAHDVKAAAECYATDAVAVTPDQGEVRGREAIAEYLRQLTDGFLTSDTNPSIGTSRATWRSTKGMSSEHTVRRCRYLRGRAFRLLENKSGCGAATSLASRMGWSLATAFTSTRWSFSDNLDCFLRCRPKPHRSEGRLRGEHRAVPPYRRASADTGGAMFTGHECARCRAPTSSRGQVVR